MPKICYPTLVLEFYANLHVNQKDEFVSSVSDTQITLSPLFFSAILKTPLSNVSIYTKRGYKI